MKGLLILGLGITASLTAQNAKQDSIKEIQSVTFTKRLPVSKEIINVEKDLGSKNLAQDLPILLKNQMSVVSTSDAGNGVGYTGFRIRGTAGNSINVMMNGVPYNDSESQGTYFVDVPDLASSAKNIVIQRGVGTSSNGVSAFGASVNILTKNPEEKPYFLTQNSYGSFNTRKNSFEAGTGKILNHQLSLMGRYSVINSDGYIDRAFSKLNSYNFTALFEKNDTKLRFLAFGGKEKTYQAWNGISSADYAINPRMNYSGAIYNADYSKVIGYYDNETDNYRQNHYHLLWEQKLNEVWNLETTLHYTKGKGYYENYKQDSKLSKYNLNNFNINNETIKYADLIRKKWLDNDFYGVVANAYGNFENLNLNFGLAGNQYKGLHFGQVTSVKNYTQIPENYEYYRNQSEKDELAGFAKAIYKWNQVELFGDVQLRNIRYKTEILLAGAEEGANLNKNWLFFNPKAGISYLLNNGKVFFSYAHAHREPNRDDLIANPSTEAEKLHDFELGIEKKIGAFSFTANAYYMYYINQLVLTGEINNVGSFIRANSGSYRTGLEIGMLAQLSKQLQFSANATFSQNINKNFKTKTSNGILDLGNTPISFSPNIIANASVKYKPLENFELNFINQFVGKQYLDNTKNEAYLLKEYFVSDINAMYQLQQFKHTELGIMLSINNIFNQKYVNNGYVYEGAYYFPQAGINYMLGMSLKIK